MHMILDALWRAVTDCLRGRVMAWSLFPLLLVAGMAALVGVFWWDAAAASVQAWLEAASWLQWLWGWMGQGTAAASAVAAAVLLVLVISPVMVMVALAIVAVVMTPQMVALVAERRFPQLQRKQGRAGWAAHCGPWDRRPWPCWPWCCPCRCGWCHRWCWCCRR
ncbi:EI24 domain-containing protein [Comamonas aquatica]|uniref:EI24 domain-containing protein n=2 Tax=Comamonas aquatica TaxID=225991 RepID=UPI001EF346D6|nr:EI24 domain-containing protein [Comamonas aquatica]